MYFYRWCEHGEKDSRRIHNYELLNVYKIEMFMTFLKHGVSHERKWKIPDEYINFFEDRRPKV